MTATVSNIIESNFGNKRAIFFDLVVGSYATNGVALAAATLGFGGELDLVLCERKDGVLYAYNHSTNKIQAYRQPAITVTGTLNKPNVTVTDGTITLQANATGPNAVQLQISTDTATGILQMISGVTGVSIPSATFGITPVTMALATAMVFTNAGSANGGKFEEVTAGVNLASTVKCMAIGVA